MFKKIFVRRTIKEWNSISEDAVNHETAESFKSLISRD